MSLIINPAQERLVKEAKDGLIMDEKNLARTIYANSFVGNNNGMDPLQAFEEARYFIAEQTRRFPLNNTVDGRSKE